MDHGSLRLNPAHVGLWTWELLAPVFLLNDLRSTTIKGVPWLATHLCGLSWVPAPLGGIRKKNKKRAYGLSLGLYSLEGLIRWLGVAVHFLMQMAYIFPKWANSRLDIRPHGLELGSEPE